MKLKENGIEIFSITDHDNIDSIKEMKKIDKKGLIYIPGVEVSCEKDGYKMHILGYNVDGDNVELNEMCRDMKLRKNIRNLEIIQQLKENFGIIISREETERLLTADGFVGQTTIARLLTQRGDIPNIQYAFDNYFKYMKLKTPATTYLDKAIKIIHKAGGYAILAHPITIEKKYGVNVEDIFYMFANAGIDGIEIFNSKHSLNDIKRYLKIVNERNLLISGGSDFHGEIMKPNIKLGGLSKDCIEKQNHYNVTVISKCISEKNLALESEKDREVFDL